MLPVSVDRTSKAAQPAVTFGGGCAGRIGQQRDVWGAGGRMGWQEPADSVRTAQGEECEPSSPVLRYSVIRIT